MRPVILLIVLLVSMLPAIGFATEVKQGAPKSPPSAHDQSPQTADEKAIRLSAEEFVSAFNRGDAKAIGALWTPNCEYVDETGRMFGGRDAVEKEYAAFFKANPGLKIEVSISSIKVIGSRAAIEEGAGVVKNAEGAMVSKGSYTAIHAKDGGKWLLASVRDRAEPSLSKRPRLEDLEWLIGHWTTAKGSKAIDMSYKWIADKKFLQLSYSAQEEGAVIRSGVQIVGRNPLSGEIISWSFDSTGGYGRGQWRPLKRGLIIESHGIMADGAPTAATEILSKTGGDTFTWKSVNRSVAGQSLNDSETLTIKRKPK